MPAIPAPTYQNDGHDALLNAGNQGGGAAANPPTSSTSNGGGNGVTGSRAGVTYFNEVTEGSSNASISYLTAGQKWGTNGIGNGLTLTYSVGTADSSFNYSGGAVTNKSILLDAQVTGATNAMNGWAAVSNLVFQASTDSANNAGDIRWNNTTDASVNTAYAYYPTTSPVGGDIWFGKIYSAYQNPVVNGYGFHTFLHELGHALGLNHPHDSQVTAKAGEDQMKYSVMSYRAYDGQPVNAGYSNSFYPSGPMLNDIAAIQYLYGVNTTFHNGDDTYSWGASAKVFETIWDAGGSDTISAATQSQACTLYLTAGKWSKIGVAFWNGHENVRDCLTIAYGATIENAIGSNYADTIEGNDAANDLKGGAGNDSINAGAGADLLYGEAGNDQLDGAAGSDKAMFGGNANEYTMTFAGGVITVLDNLTNNGNDGSDSLSNIEILHFADRDITLPDNGLRYIASYGDLINAMGTNANAGINHYLANGYREGRTVTFDAAQYLAKYADVQAYAGSDLELATRHFITTGYALGRSNALDQFVGTGGNDSFTGGSGNDTIDGGVGRDTANYSGNFSDYTLRSVTGLIQVQDNNLANGNEGTDNLSNMEVLHFADRDFPLVDGLRYIAAYPDLINAFHANSNAGFDHYLYSGYNEGRNRQFDVVLYLAKYADLRAAFGTNLKAAVTHYINFGYTEGRNTGVSGNDLLQGSALAESLSADTGHDTITGGGGNDTIDGGTGTDYVNYTGNFADYGFSVTAGVIQVTDNNLANGNEGVDRLSNVEVLHFANRDVTLVDGLRYIASYGDLISLGTNADAGLASYLNSGAAANRSVTFDPEVYLNKYADLRAAFGDNLIRATKHFINSGYAEGRNLDLSGNNSLLGSSANNTLNGGAGNDLLTGAAGADTFQFDAASGQDVISDFSHAAGDVIALKINLNGSGITDAASALAHTSNNGSGYAVVNLGGGNSITLTGVSTASLTTADFVIFA